MIISMKNVHYKRQGKTILEDINWELKRRSLGYFRTQRGWKVNPSSYFNG